MSDVDDQINQIAAFARLRLSHLQLVATLVMHGEVVAPMDLDRLWELRDDHTAEGEAEVATIRGTFTAALDVAQQKIDARRYS